MNLPLKNGCLEVDNSFLEALTTCPRKCDYQYIQKRIPVGDKPALNFGSAIHRAMEYRYATYKNDPPDIMAEQDILDKALLPYFQKNPATEGDHRTIDFAFELVKMYNQRYSHEPFSLLTREDGSVICEASFAVPLFTHRYMVPMETGVVSPEGIKEVVSDLIEVPVIYTGRIDLPVLWDGQIIILDFKTASMLGDNATNAFKIAPQFEGYCWAFEKTTGREVSGFCVRGIRTKAKPATTKLGWDKWWDDSFMSHKEYLRPGQLDEWHTNTVALIKEFFYHVSQDYMPQKKKACTMYGKCPYYDICYSPQHDRPRLLAGEDFTTNQWSPLK